MRATAARRILFALAACLVAARLEAQVANVTGIVFTNDSTRMTSGAGTPEGSIVGAPGDVYISTNGSIYTKAAGSGTDNSGWVAVGTGGSGTVTSVGLTLPGIISVSGSPVTTSGTIAGTLATQSANRVWAGPTSGGAAQPAFRQIVFGDIADNGCASGQIPKYDGAAWACADDAGASSGAPTASQYVTLATDATLTNERVLTEGTGIDFVDGGAGSTLTVKVDASEIDTGTVPVANGGTNLTAAADDNVMVGNGTTWQTKAIADCDDAGGNHLNYDTTTNAFSCGTSGGGGGGTVTNTGTLTSGKTIIGNGTTDVTVSSLTANLVTSSSGTLAGATAGANDKLLGSGNSGSGSAYAEITIGSGLAMTGTTLSATGGGGSGSNEIVVYKTADESVTSNATPQNDDELLWTVGANETWTFEIVVFATSTSDTPDLTVTMGIPSGTFSFGQHALEAPATVNYSANLNAVAATGASSGAGPFGYQALVANNVTMHLYKGSIAVGGTGGTVNFKWAQDVSNGTASTIKAGSYLRALQGTGNVGRGADVQTVYASTTAVATGATAIPIDDTIPQNTEGFEVLTATIDPEDSANVLHFEVTINLAANAANKWISIALFQDSTANALAAATMYENVANGGYQLNIEYTMTAGTASSTTFKVRAGADDTSTVTINGSNGSRLFGGVLVSSIRITEKRP